MTADIKYLLCFYPGQGLIILLSGPPGTGKTLTAEAGKSTFSVSNQMQKSSHNGYIQWQTSHEGPSNTCMPKISVRRLPQQERILLKCLTLPWNGTP